MKKLIIIAYAILIGMLLRAQDTVEKISNEWEMQIVNDRTSRFYTHGSVVWGHQLGFFKFKNNCHENYFYLSWSTFYVDKVNDFVEQVIDVNIKVGDKEFQLKMMVLSAQQYTSSLGVFLLTDIENTERLSDHLLHSDSVKITIKAPDEIDAFLDIKTDIFLLNGLGVSMKKAANSCDSISAIY